MTQKKVYSMIDTFGTPGGGMMKRVNPQHQILNYIGVPSVDEYSEKVKTLGGMVIVPMDPKAKL